MLAVRRAVLRPHPLKSPTSKTRLSAPLRAMVVRRGKFSSIPCPMARHGLAQPLTSHRLCDAGPGRAKESPIRLATAPGLRTGRHGSKSSHGSPTEAVIKRAHLPGSIPNALVFTTCRLESPTLCITTRRRPSAPRRFRHGLLRRCLNSRRQGSDTPRLLAH